MLEIRFLFTGNLQTGTRVCLKNHFCNLYVSFCGIFCRKYFQIYIRLEIFRQILMYESIVFKKGTAEMNQKIKHRFQTEVSLVLTVVCIGSICALLQLRQGSGSMVAVNRQLQTNLLQASAEWYMPVATFHSQERESRQWNWLRGKVFAWMPILNYMEEHVNGQTTLEDEQTIAKILESQANEEHAVDENGIWHGEENGTADGQMAASEGTDADAGLASAQPVAEISMDQLKDFDYLLEHFYTVDSSTMIGADQLNAEELLGESMKINQETGGPKVLIFHTHSQENFADSDPDDPSTSIVGMGEYLTELLNAKGIETLHDSGVYDIINGKLDRSRAYENAEASVRPILEENPSIEVAIDLHRDGVAESTHLVTEIDGKPTAKIMYFNGLSRTRANGDIGYLYNPYIQDNLAFSLQMQVASETYYPGFARHIYLKAYRYNLHLLPKSLLIEAGAQTNTVEEMRNAMEVLAKLLVAVCCGQ